MAVDADDAGDLECRVCRTANEESNLYHPCKCDGSIRHVHQECLEMWLKHKNSGMEACELCGYTYTFKPRYADDAPSSLGGLSLATVLIKRGFTKGIPLLSRMICVFWSWLIVVPLATSWIFKFIVQSPIMADTWSFQSIQDWLLLEIMSFINPTAAASAKSDLAKEYLVTDLITGIVVTLVILTSAVILMSFLDFMRFQRVLGQDGDDIVFMVDPPDVARANHQGRDRNNQANGGPGDLAGPARRANRQWHFAGPGDRGQLDMTTEETTPEAASSSSSAGADRSSSSSDIDGAADNTTEELNSNSEGSTLKDDDEMDDGSQVDFVDQGWTGSQDEGEEDEKFSEELNPWQFPEDWDYTHGSDQSLSAFKNADDFYHWFNQTKDGGNSDDDSEDEGDSDSDESDDDAEAEAEAEAEFMGLDDDLDPMDPEAVPAGEVDIRAVLLDVLGIRGPLNVMLKNLVFLLIFNGVFLGVFASIPCNLGSFLISQAKILWASASESGVPMFAASHPLITQTLQTAQQWVDHITKISVGLRGRSIDPATVANIVVGYLATLTTVFVADKARSVNKLVFAHGPGASRASKTLKVFDNAINIMAGVMKVGFLLFLRVFFTPTLLGTTILLSYNQLARYDQEVWLSFFCRNFIGGMMLTWAAGICNMLMVTLTVLQLREVLHPDILAKIIRPQEPHLDLLSSLMHESGIVHVRRLFISLLVYLSFIVLFLYVPSMLLTEEVSGIPSDVWRVRTWYGVPQMQVLIETSAVLAIFLSLLETHKNVIGKVLFAWFHRATGLLGLTRYFMPLSYEVVALLPTHPHYRRYPDHKMYVVSRSPMVRPPSKWDSKLFERSGRWAWGDESPGPVERQVAPRLTVPSFCVLRIWLLVAISWALLVLITLACIPMPLIYGRFLLGSLGVPTWLRHDVLSMAAGLCEVLSYFTRAWRYADGWVRKVCDPCSGASFVLINLKSWAISAFIALCVGVPYRLTLELAQDPPIITSMASLANPAVILDSFCSGKFLCECLLFFVRSGMRSSISEWLGGKSAYFSVQLSQPFQVLKRDLLMALVFELFIPITTSLCCLGIVDLWQRGQLLPSLLPEPSVIAPLDVVHLFLRISSTVLAIFVARVACEPIIDIVVKLVQLFHDSAYSEKYLIGRELNNRTPEMPISTPTGTQ